MIRSFLLFLAFTGISSFNTEAFPDINNEDLLSVHPVPQIIENASLPNISAKSALVIDESSGIILYKKNIHQRLPMASLTKIMTAILILEENNLQEIVTITTNPMEIEGAKIWLRKKETFRIIDLLHGLLIHSGNDAALALAIHNAGAVEAFVEKMNKKALDLGLKDTHFTNPIGYDDENNQHFSTAKDLAFLTLYALKKPVFREIIGKKSSTIYSINKNIPHSLKTTNKLLNSYLLITGVKTGTTDKAGECLIAMHPLNKGKSNLLTILLNSKNRFQETKILLTNLLENIYW